MILEGTAVLGRKLAETRYSLLQNKLISCICGGLWTWSFGLNMLQGWELVLPVNLLEAIVMCDGWLRDVLPGFCH